MPFFGSVTGADGQVYTRTGDPNWLRNSNDHYVAASSIGGVSGGGSAGGDLTYAKNSIYSPTSTPTYGPAGGVSAASLGYTALQRQLTNQEQLNQVYQPQLQSYMQGDPTGGYGAQMQSLMQGQFSTNDPSYQWRLQQGQGAVERSAVARGLLNSGQAAIELMNYGQGAASTEYQAQFNRTLQAMQASETSFQSGYNRLAELAGMTPSQQIAANQANLNYAKLGANTKFEYDQLAANQNLGYADLNARTGLGYAGLAERASADQAHLNLATDQFSYQAAQGQLHQDQMNNTDKAFLSMMSGYRSGGFAGGGGGAGAGASSGSGASSSYTGAMGGPDAPGYGYTGALPSPFVNYNLEGSNGFFGTYSNDGPNYYYGTSTLPPSGITPYYGPNGIPIYSDRPGVDPSGFGGEVSGGSFGMSGYSGGGD